MNKFVKAVIGVAFTVLLFGAMVRTSGRALIPFAFLFAVLLSYVGYTILRGKETPYPRIATGTFERTEEADIRLSGTDSCTSCTDHTGDGVRLTTTTELVFLGVPLVVLDRTQNVLCDVCADPLGSDSWEDSIDRELARETESE